MNSADLRPDLGLTVVVGVGNSADAPIPAEPIRPKCW